MYRSWAMLPAPTLTSPVCPPAAAPSYGVCLLRPIRTVRAGLPAPFASLGRLLSSHQAIVRVSAAALVFTFIVVFSQQAPTQAVPQATLPAPQSLLPETLAIGVPTDEAIRVSFDEPMDGQSVAAAFALSPATEAWLAWSPDQTELSITPAASWRAGQSYVVVIDESARTADGDALAAPRRIAFSTKAPPSISGFEVDLAEVDLPQADPAEAAFADALDHAAADEAVLSTERTARDVSATSAVRISFSTQMARSSVRDAFSIAPAVEGELSWSGGDLVFTPTERLEPGGRYTISLAGARDQDGNELGGKLSFSFVVRAAPQLVRTTPELGADGVEPSTVEMWFSQPMDVDATNAAFGLIDTSTGELVAGRLNWNESGTQLVYAPDAAFAGGRTFEVVLGPGAADAAGRPMTAEWTFSTKEGPAPVEQPPAPTTRAAGAAGATAAAPAPPRPAPIAFVPGPSSGLEGYGLNQINAARAAYGFPPLVLDPTLSAMASAHAWNQIHGGYYAHAPRPGGYSAWGENQCHHYAMRAQATMDWCHAVFMSEPWPGHPNHIGNILSTRYTRVGIGVADSGSRVVITWDFAN
jgi:uncharacterized protein YkwD